jgi:hypothetical protein
MPSWPLYVFKYRYIPQLRWHNKFATVCIVQRELDVVFFIVHDSSAATGD